MTGGRSDLLDNLNLQKFGNDKRNTIYFISDKWPEYWKINPPIDDSVNFLSGIIEQEKIPIIANTKKYIRFNKNEGIDEIIGFDIFINCVNYNWKNKSSYFLKKELSFDIENLLCHEIGHVLGLPDMTNPEDKFSTMFNQICLGETFKRTIGERDFEKFRSIYKDDIKEWKDRINKR